MMNLYTEYNQTSGSLFCFASESNTPGALVSRIPLDEEQILEAARRITLHRNMQFIKQAHEDEFVFNKKGKQNDKI